VQFEPVSDCPIEFAEIAIHLKVATRELVIVLRNSEQVLKDRNQIDVEVRKPGFELQTRQMCVDLSPGNPFTIIVNGVVFVPHVCWAVHHTGVTCHLTSK